MGDADLLTKAGEARKGYTYWKRDIDDAHLIPENKPQKIAADAAVAISAATPSTGSRWNTAGTWEEKDMSAVSRPELERVLCDSSFSILDEADGNKICITKATVTG